MKRKKMNNYIKFLKVLKIFDKKNDVKIEYDYDYNPMSGFLKIYEKEVAVND